MATGVRLEETRTSVSLEPTATGVALELFDVWSDYYFLQAWQVLQENREAGT